MTITTTALGTYTTQISLSGELNGLNMIAAIDAAIVAAGWTQYDVTTLTRVYRSLNLDGTTYKYIGIYIDPYNGKITTTAYESWNASTHTGTNEAFTFSRTGEMGYFGSNTDVIVMASPNWCLLQTYIANQPSQWSGVIEFQRELSEDTSAPCFAWICSSLILNASLANGVYYASFPRTAGGLTGAAAVSNGLQTQFSRFGVYTNLHAPDLITYSTDAWDSTKKNIQSIRPTVGLSEIHGRAVGLKALYNAGVPFNRIAVPVDTTFNYSSTGTSTEHWVLGITKYISNAFAAAAGNGNPQVSSITTLSGNGLAVACTGLNYYILTTAGLQKLSANSTTLGAPSTVTGGPTGGVDCVFDGRYVYTTSSTSGVSRFDTQNADAVSTLALPLFGGTICWDGTNIWVAAAGSRTNNTVYKIDPVAFTIVATITIGNAAPAASIGGMCSDYLGNLYFAITSGAVYKIVSSTNTAGTFGGGIAGCSASGCMYDGSNLLIGSVNAGVTYNTAIFNASTAASISNVTLSTSASFVSATPKAPVLKYGPNILVGYQTSGTSAIAGEFGAAGYSFSPVITSTSPAGAFATTALYCDGSKVFGCGTGNSFFQYLNINHPEDGTTAQGRLAIPK